MTSKNQQDKRWKVPTSIKVAIGLFGTICLVIAIVGSVHGETIPNQVKGCIGNDQTSGQTFINERCLSDPATTTALCKYWPTGVINNTATIIKICPHGIHNGPFSNNMTEWPGNTTYFTKTNANATR